MAVVAFTLCALVIFGLILKMCVFRKKTVKLPPLAPGALPVIGHTFKAISKIEHLYEVYTKVLNTALKNGDKSVLLRVGVMDIFHILDPEDCLTIINSSWIKKDYLYNFFKPLLSEEGLILAENPLWKRHRKLLNPTFNQKVLETYLTVFNDQSRQLTKNIDQNVERGQFDPFPYLQDTVLQVVCATIMGVSVNEEDIRVVVGKAVETFTSGMLERLRKFWHHYDFIYNLSNLKKKQDAAARSLHEFSLKVIKKKRALLIAEKSKDPKHDPKPRFKSFLDFLLDLDESGEFLTESEIQAEVHTFLAAAFDTTFHSVGNTFLTIGSYPKVQQKVFDELQTVFKGSNRDLTNQDLHKLKYLDAVVKETMRLYPAVLITARTPIKDLDFEDYTLPEGSTCFVSIYALNRHPVWGPDAEQFRPERWLDGSMSKNAARAYAVFGMGKRGCIGYNFALMVIKTIVCHIVRNYRITADVTKLVQKIDLVVTPISGHYISLERRKSDGLLDQL